MDFIKMIAELQQERAQIDDAIMALERVARGQGRRRGRPPAWMSAQASTPKRRRHPPSNKNKSKAEPTV
jgi:hypothetical protein